MGHNTEPLFVNKPPDVSSKPTEKRGLAEILGHSQEQLMQTWIVRLLTTHFLTPILDCEKLLRMQMS